MEPINRRTFLQAMSAAAAIGGLGALAACSNDASGSSSSGAGSGTGEPPTFAPAGTADPDLVSAFPGGMHGFFSYPGDPVAAVAQAPLSGGTVSALTYTFDPVAPGKDENPLWQELNTRLGGTLDVTYASAADYPQRFATTIAGGDLPDLVSIFGSVQQLPAMLRAEFQDLSEYLAGDAAEDYPNLGGLATESWQEAMLDGSIWGVPIARPPISSIVFVRKDLVEQAGLPAQPADFAEFKELLTGLTDERDSTWASGDPGAVLAMLTSSLGIPGAPSAWMEKDGALTSNIETPEYEQALADTAALFEAGVFHPDGIAADNNQRNDWFTNGTTPLVVGGFVGYSKYVMWGAGVPGFELATMLPFGYDGSTEPKHARGTVMQAMTVIKKSDPDRVRELLRVLDWLATPFGSAEYLLRYFGIEGETFAFDGTDPVVNSRGENLRLVPFKYVADASMVIYDPGHREVTQARFDYQEAAMDMMAPDPTLGLYSETEAAKKAQLDKALDDARNDIITGRQPVSSWSAALDSWRSGGGDAIRTEYEEALGEGVGSG